MSTHNMCFYGEIKKIIPELSPYIAQQVLCPRIIISHNHHNDRRLLSTCISLSVSPFANEALFEVKLFVCCVSGVYHERFLS